MITRIMIVQFMEAIVTVTRITEAASTTGNLTGNSLELTMSVYQRDTSASKLVKVMEAMKAILA